MFRNHIIGLLGLSFALISPGLTRAQGMMNWSVAPAVSADVVQTQQEEQTGQNFWTQLQNKSTSCANLKDEDFDALGEYFMGQMMGTAVHANMNAAMKAQVGEASETRIHVALGKRFSSCDPTAAFPGNGQGFATMFTMMTGGSMMGNFTRYNSYGWGNMMGNWGTAGSVLGWLWMLLVWALVIVAIIALWRWANRSNMPQGSALEILKTRYAKGEIDAKEFAEKKKLLEE